MRNQTVLLIAFVACFVISSILSASAIDVASCRMIDANGTWDLTASTSHNDTCFQINVSNVTFNCHGFTVRYDVNGTSAAATPRSAFNVSHAFNVTIRDCPMQDANANGSNSYGIYLLNVTNSTLLNNTIVTNGTNNAEGIRLMGNSSHIVIDSNTITTNGTSSDNYGIFATGGSVGVRILNNRINTTGTADNYAVNLENGVFNATVSNNSIFVNGTGSGNAGVNIENGTQDINVSNTNITVNSAGSAGVGIRMNSSVLRTLIHNNLIWGGANGQGAEHIGLAMRGDVTGSIVADNFINASGTGGFGLHLNESPVVNNSFLRNTISTRDSGGATVFLDDGPTGGPLNNTFIGNFLRVSIGSDGIRLRGARMTTFFATSINGSVGTTAYAVFLSATNDTIFNNTLMNEPRAWLYASGEAASLALQTNMTNTTFLTKNGSINYNGTVQVNNGTDLTFAKLNVSQNLVFVNVSSSANTTVFNQSALIALYNLTASVVRVQVDSESDGTFADCELTQCPRGSYVLGNFTFNVTRFSTYQTAANYSCGILNENATLTMSLNATGTCFNINRNKHLILDCAGYAIRFGSNGGSVAATPVSAINLTDASNVTVRNCIMQDVNSSDENGYGILVYNTSNSTLYNNTISTNGTNHSEGIRLIGNGTYVVVDSNTIRSNGSVRDNYGIFATGVNATVIMNNRINVSGTIDNYGVNLENQVFNITVVNTTIDVLGNLTGNAGVNVENGSNVVNISNSNISVISQGGSGFGIRMNSSVFRVMAFNNNIMAGADGLGSSHIGVYLTNDVSAVVVQDNNINTTGNISNLGISLNESLVTNNSFVRNTISTRGTNSTPILLDDGATGGPWNNTFTGNLLRVPVGAHAIQLIGARMTTFIATTINGSMGGVGTYAVHLTATNDTLFNSTLINEPQAWMYLSGAAASLALQTNITNTTFLTRNGSIRINGTVQVNNGTDLTFAKLNVSHNLAFINVSTGANMSTFNQSGVITLHNLTATSNVRVRVDSESDGSFVDCDQGTVCTSLTPLVAGNITFNVTRFSSYSTIANYSCGDLNENASLTMDLNASATCLNIRASHLTLNCAGFRIRYDRDGGSAVGTPSIAVNVSGSTNLTVENCTFQDANSSGAHGYGLSLFNVTNSTFRNITLQTNGTNDNYGIRMTARSHNNTLYNNTVFTRGSSTLNYGVYINASRDNVFINNSITTENANSTGFVLMTDARNNRLQSNNLSVNLSQSLDLNISLSNDTHLVNQRIYNWSMVDSDLVVNETSLGKLQFLTNTSVLGGNLSGEIVIENHRFFVNSSTRLGLNQTTQITFINVTFTTPKIEYSSNGTDPFFTECVSPQCVQWGSFGNRTSKFNVTQWSVYRLVETVADVPVVRGGSSGGGGGGGGSGSAVGGKYTIILASATSTMQTVHNKAEYKYRVGGVDAKLFVADVTREQVTLDLSPSIARRVVKPGETIKQDVNSDGTYDLSIEVVSTTIADAKLKLKLISEPVPASERLAPVAPAPTTVVKKQAEPSAQSKAPAKTVSAPSAPANEASSSQQQQAVKASAPASSGGGLASGAFSEGDELQKSSSNSLLIALLVLSLVAVGAYWYLQKK